MNLLRVRPISLCESIPDFGVAFARHIEVKHHPDARKESLSAWSLLAETIEARPIVEFAANGKPYFADHSCHFSLAHSGNLAAVLISDSPCGIDIERVRDYSENMRKRCLLPNEQEMDFFEAWTLKECIGKLTGEGIRPRKVDTTRYPDLNRMTQLLQFSGEFYRLSAVSESIDPFSIDIIDKT